MESVTFAQVQKFIDALNDKHKEADWIYALPTEAEWEYACRGGPMADKSASAFLYYGGGKPTDDPARQGNINNTLKRTTRVGSFLPNSLGLYDMHGNVKEWCEDQQLAHNLKHMYFVRGGNFSQKADASSVDAFNYAKAFHNLGLRVARVPRSAFRVRKLVVFNLGMEFRKVPGGKSWLGGESGNPGPREVHIPYDFYLGTYKVTQEEWQQFMGNNPSGHAHDGIDKDKVMGIAAEDLKRFPVERISYDQAQEFIKALNDKSGETGWIYRLPTELEWEYACRGGPMADRADSAFRFYFDTPSNECVPGQDANVAKSLNRTSKVGSYRPNRLGLYDMHGNVNEWCLDGNTKDDFHSIRSGNYLSGGGCNILNIIPGKAGYHDVGLRVARVPADAVIPRRTWNENAMELSFVPKGKAWLGGSAGKPGDREVNIPYDFYMGTYEVTHEEWDRIMGKDKNPSFHTRTGPGKNALAKVVDADLKRFPVENVSWNDCQEFLKRLNKLALDKGESPEWEYRLPTEDEWEYACRGGPGQSKEAYSFDFYLDVPANKLSPDKLNFGPTALGRTCKVGSYLPNRLGIFDMHGNVWEWCHDGGPNHVGRGGGWSRREVDCRAISRGQPIPSDRLDNLGLRVVRVPVGKTP